MYRESSSLAKSDGSSKGNKDSKDARRESNSSPSDQGGITAGINLLFNWSSNEKIFAAEGAPATIKESCKFVEIGSVN